MAISERDRRAMIFGAVGLGAILIYILAVEPVMDWYDELISDHQVLAARVARVMRDNQKYEYFTAQVAKWEEKVGELVPPKLYSEQITMVTREIITSSQKSGVQLKGATPTAATPWADDPRLALALIHIDAEAGWENVFKFVTALHHIENLLSIEQIELSSDPKKEGKIKLKLTVSVLVQSAEDKENLWAS